MHEEYGEADRPLPSYLVNQMKDKFVEWDIYKLSYIKNKFEQK